jgi:hypothetical protein
LIEGQINRIPLNFSFLELLAPYILIAHYPLVFSKPQSAIPLLDAKYPDSIASECLTRMRNDISLVNMMSFLTDSDSLISELTIVSFPKKLEFVLTHLEILNFAALQYFTISDADSDTDFDFVKGYTLCRFFFSLLQSVPGKVKPTIQEMDKLLSAVKNPATQQTIILDLFSLLFLQQNSLFLITIDIAKQVLRVLNKYSAIPFITEGFTMVKKASLPFASLFVRDVSVIFKGIAANDWIEVDQLTRRMPAFRPLYLLGLAIFSIYHNDQIPRECEGELDWINLELFFSLVCDPTLINLAKSRFRQRSLFISRGTIVLPACEYIPFVRKPFRDLENCHRRFCEKSGINLQAFQGLEIEHSLAALPKMAHWKLEMDNLQSFDDNFTQFLIGGAPTIPSGHLCSLFIKYLLDYRRYSLLTPGVDVDSIFANIDIVRAVAGLFNAGHFAVAEEFGKQNGISLFDLVITHLKSFNLSETFNAGHANRSGHVSKSQEGYVSKFSGHETFRYRSSARRLSQWSYRRT